MVRRIADSDSTLRTFIRTLVNCVHLYSDGLCDHHYSSIRGLSMNSDELFENIAATVTSTVWYCRLMSFGLHRIIIDPSRRAMYVRFGRPAPKRKRLRRFRHLLIDARGARRESVCAIRTAKPDGVGKKSLSFTNRFQDVAIIIVRPKRRFRIHWENLNYMVTAPPATTTSAAECV